MLVRRVLDYPRSAEAIFALFTGLTKKGAD
jgi:hypothetical protein